MRAPDFLKQALAEMEDRAAVRDTPDGERSMAATVAAFNAIYGTSLTETQGWQFMALLKIVRGSQGRYRDDDHTDQVAYAALAGESARKAWIAQEKAKPFYSDTPAATVDSTIHCNR